MFLSVDCAPGLIKYCGRNQYNDDNNNNIDRDRGNQVDYDDDGSSSFISPRLLTWPDLQDLQTSKGQTKATNIQSLWYARTSLIPAVISNR